MVIRRFQHGTEHPNSLVMLPRVVKLNNKSWHMCSSLRIWQMPLGAAFLSRNFKSFHSRKKNHRWKCSTCNFRQIPFCSFSFKGLILQILPDSNWDTWLVWTTLCFYKYKKYFLYLCTKLACVTARYTLSGRAHCFWKMDPVLKTTTKPPQNSCIKS